MSPQNSKEIRNLKILLHAGFVVSGISTVLIGQVLPYLTKKLNLNDQQAGNFFIAQFTGSIIGTLAANWFGKNNKFLPASVIGCFLMGAGILILNFNSFELCLVGFFVNGLGIGFTLPSINMLILELDPLRATSALNILNFFWGIGAILSQPFVDYLSSENSILTPTLILGFWVFAVGIGIALMPKDVEQKPFGDSENVNDFSVPIWTNPIAWAIALFAFIEVGFESGIGGWLKTYTQRIEGGDVPNLLPPIFLYFLFFVVGRGFAPLFLRFLDDNKMLLVSLLVILIGMTVLLSAEDLLFLSIGSSIAGLGTAPIFATNLARFTKFFGASASRRATPLFISGTLGAIFITWIIGFISNYYENDLRSGMFVLLASIAVLIALQSVLSFQNRQVKV